jgi:hypothetical protein
MKLAARIDLAVERLQRMGVSFKSLSSAPWIGEIEARIGRQLPDSYRNLVVRYSFPTLVLGPIELFANLGDASRDDLTIAPFRDPLLSGWLVRSGHFHFARTTFGNYDPVCINLNQAASPEQPVAVVQFDHEAILLERQSVSCAQIASSFLGLLEGDR